MTDREEDSFSRIIHNGYGPQIVGPNYGDIKYEIDPNMRAMLTGVSEDAAKLVGIVKQALSDGFMSEYSVTAFNRTAQNISDDLVDRLGWATRNLNEDNVDRLGYATRNLTEDNVDRLGYATRNITEETVNRLCGAAENISERTADKFANINYELSATAERIEIALKSATTTRESSPQPSVVPPIPLSDKGAGKRGLRFKLILCIAGLMVLTGVTLEKHHLGGGAVFFGVLGVVIPMLFWINKALRKSGSRGPVNATQYDPNR
jgi:hypothetical protein